MNLYLFFSSMEHKLEFVVILLLLVTIYYAAKLNGRLSVLRENRGEFETLARQIIEAVNIAEGSVSQIRATAGKTVDDLQVILNQSTGLRDELNFMLERSDVSIERLEKLLQDARKHEKEFVEIKKNNRKQNRNIEEKEKKAAPVEAVKAEIAPTPKPKHLSLSTKEKRNVDEKTEQKEDELEPRASEEEIELLNALKSLR